MRAPSSDEEVLTRLLSRVEVDPSGCWPWQGYLMKNGYGTLYWGSQGCKRLVHRVAYSLMVGPIPDGLHIDHLCRVRHCVNPDHLEAVTNHVNNLRGETFGAVNVRKTHCLRGHPLTGDNLAVRVSQYGRPARSCRECRRMRDRGELVAA